jgi:septal ring factor EnvC (AmiA/AmiB activator)
VAGNEDRIKLLLSGDNPNRINRDLQLMAYVSQAQARLLAALRANLAAVEDQPGRAAQNARDELEEIAAGERQQKTVLEQEKAKRAALLADPVEPAGGAAQGSGQGRSATSSAWRRWSTGCQADSKNRPKRRSGRAAGEAAWPQSPPRGQGESRGRREGAGPMRAGQRPSRTRAPGQGKTGQAKPAPVFKPDPIDADEPSRRSRPGRQPEPPRNRPTWRWRRPRRKARSPA